jgi:hypothetical protein
MPAAEFRLSAKSTTATSSTAAGAVDLSVGLLSFFLFLVFFYSSSLMMFERSFVFPFVGLRRRSVLNARCGVGWWVVAVGLRRRFGVVIVDGALPVLP